jgi:hypothetical protein
MAQENGATKQHCDAPQPHTFKATLSPLAMAQHYTFHSCSRNKYMDYWAELLLVNA